MRTSRRRAGASLLLLAALVVLSRSGWGDGIAAPVTLQAELLVKVAEYDKNFSARAGERARVLLVTKAGNADSANVNQQMANALGRFDEIAGLPHDEMIITYPGATELGRICRDRHIAIVYFAPGFSNDVESIRNALNGVDVLSVGGVPDYVRNGIVLGFDVVSGRPKLLFNLTQARLQRVALAAAVLKLMTVYE